MRITFCVVSWTAFVRVVFTDLVQTQQTRDVPAVTLLQHWECSDSRGDGHVRHSHVTIVSAPTEKKKHKVTELLKFRFHNLKSNKLYKSIIENSKILNISRQAPAACEMRPYLPQSFRFLCAVLSIMVHDTSNLLQISNLPSFSAVSFGVRRAGRSQYVRPPSGTTGVSLALEGQETEKEHLPVCRCGNLHHCPTSKRRLSFPSWFKFKSTFTASATCGLHMEHCVNVQGLRSGLRTCICIWGEVGRIRSTSIFNSPGGHAE
jgi:hypothetical protein